MWTRVPAVNGLIAASDASALTTEVRRVALVHSVVAFFYNVVVVAVAFQVLQQVLG